MESRSSPTFPCPQCGRKIRWSRSIAGKSGRCKCGAAIRVPDSVASASHSRSSSHRSAVAVVAVPAAPPLAIASVLCYARPIDEDSSESVPRSRNTTVLFFVVLVIGLVAVLAWLACQYQSFPVAQPATPFPSTPYAAVLAAAKFPPSAAFPSPDDLITRRIDSSSGVSVIEAHAWRRTSLTYDPQQPFNQLADQLYVAGAPKVFFDIVPRHPVSDPSHLTGPALIYIQLPSNPSQRAACIALAGQYQTRHDLAPSPALNPTDRYLSIDLNP